MNAPHIHLLINHLPIIGLIIGILVVIFGLLTKKQVVSSVGLWITMIAGISSYPTMYSGGASEHFFEENEGQYCVSEDLIHEHEEAAELAFWPCIVTGVFAGIALFGHRKGHKHTKKAEIVLISKAGLTGGEIRHPEISSCCSAEGSQECQANEGCAYMNSEKCTANCTPGCKHDGTDACCKGDTTLQK